MSTDSCPMVLRANGEPRHLCDIHASINHRHVKNYFCFTSSWCLSHFQCYTKYVFCIVYSEVQCRLSPPYLGNAQSGPSPSPWPPFITLPTIDKFPLVWRRLCDIVRFPSEGTITAVCVLSRGSSSH